MKRKLFTLLVALFVVCSTAFALTACGGGNPPEKQTISGITFVGATYTYDAEEKTLLVTGTLPEGVSVAYTNNVATNAGTYNAQAVLSGNGYETLTLNAMLTINKSTYDMSDVSWNYSTPFIYDGTEKTISLTNLPSGVTVKTYSNNKKTNAGSYIASATFNFDTTNYYAPSVSNCAWAINKAVITGVSVESDQSVNYDGNKHLPTITGNIPLGVSKTFAFNGETYNDGVSAIGTYEVTIILSGANYQTKELTCEFKIKIDATALATSIFNKFKAVPDPWSFLPASFAPQNRSVSSVLTYDTFVSVQNIPTNGMGKQLNLVYGILTKASKALSFVTPVFGAMNSIKTAFIAFVNNNPDNYKTFSTTIAGLNISLALTDSEYEISTSVSSVGVKLYANTATEEFGARVQLTDTTVLKFAVSQDEFILALNVLNASSTYIEFARDNNDNLVGMVYEYLSAGDLSIINTSAMITSDETYTTLIGTKGDFIPTSVSRNCEVYRNSDGRLVGTEVREEMELPLSATYNTLWYNLSSITGINYIMKVDEASGTNADKIYINNYTNEPIHTSLVGLADYKKAASRQYDIEFKTMYFYQYNTQKEEYEEVKMEIPMMFIQEEFVDDFEKNFAKKNPDAVSSVALNVPSTTKTAVSYGYYTLLVEYDKLKDAVSQQDIINFCNQ